MGNPADFQEVITWIVTRLNADATLTSMDVTGAYMYSAPEGGVDTLPYIIGGKQSGTHNYVLDRQAYATHYLAIKCVDLGFDGGARARTIMGRVVDLLELEKPQLPSGRYVMDIQANNSYEYDEQESGNVNFFHSVVNFKVVIGNTV